MTTAFPPFESNTPLQRWLAARWACSDARRWVRTQTPRQAVLALSNDSIHDAFYYRWVLARLQFSIPICTCGGTANAGACPLGIWEQASLSELQALHPVEDVITKLEAACAVSPFL